MPGGAFGVSPEAYCSPKATGVISPSMLARVPARTRAVSSFAALTLASVASRPRDSMHTGSWEHGCGVSKDAEASRKRFKGSSVVLLSEENEVAEISSPSERSSNSDVTPECRKLVASDASHRGLNGSLGIIGRDTDGGDIV